MRTIICALALLAILSACTIDGPICSEPYIVHDRSCCLDRDSNHICDKDENATLTAEPGATSCELCPPKFVTQTQEVTVYRYVCTNGSVMMQATDCEERIVSDANEFTLSLEQDPEYITDFDARAACRGQYQAAEIHLIVAQTPLNVTFEVLDDPHGEWHTLSVLEGGENVIDDEYYYLGFCDSIECSTVTQAQLPSDGAYLVRALLQYPDKKIYTRDLLLDPTPEGEYGQNKC